MKFIEAYDKVLTERFSNWKHPDKNNKIFDALYELSDIIDKIVPNQIKLQEKSLYAGIILQQELLINTSLQKGISTKTLSSYLNEALTNDISPWSVIWTELKTAAIATGTSSGTYPPSITFPSVMTGDIAKNILLGYSSEQTPGLQAIAYAFQKYLIYWYSYYKNSGPPNTYAVNY